MSDITKTIRTRLLASVSVSGVVGARIYPDILPQKDGKVTTDLPAITLEVISGQSDSDLTGGVGLGRQRVSVTCYAHTRTATRTLSEAVRVQMLSMRGDVSGQHVSSVTCESRVDLVDPPADASDKWRYIHSIDFEVIHSEGVAATS